MSTRQGPGLNAPALTLNTEIVGHLETLELPRKQKWDVHNAWWADEENRRLLQRQCDLDNERSGTKKRARADLHRCWTICEQLVKGIKGESLISDLSSKQLMAVPITHDQIKTNMRVLLAAGVVVNLTKAHAPRGHHGGRAPRRVLTYLVAAADEHRTSSNLQLVRQPPGTGAPCRTTPSILLRSNTDGTDETTSEVTSSNASTHWKRSFEQNLERRLQENRNMSRQAVQRQYGEQLRRTAEEASKRWSVRAPADDDLLMAFYADKIMDRPNPATWQAIEDRYPSSDDR